MSLTRRSRAPLGRAGGGGIVADRPGHASRARAEKWGPEFAHFWNEAITQGFASIPERMLEQIGIEVTHQTAAGSLRYVVTQVGAKPSTASSLFLWLPVDAESLALHQQMGSGTPCEVYWVKRSA